MATYRDEFYQDIIPPGALEKFVNKKEKDRFHRWRSYTSDVLVYAAKKYGWNYKWGISYSTDSWYLVLAYPNTPVTFTIRLASHKSSLEYRNYYYGVRDFSIVWPAAEKDEQEHRLYDIFALISNQITRRRTDENL